MSGVNFDHWSLPKNNGGKDTEWPGPAERESGVIQRDKKLLERFSPVPAGESVRVPPGGLYVTFGITLAGPYLSKDDRRFRSMDNAIRREWAFQVPMISATTWKGNIRSAAHRLVTAEGNEAWAEAKRGDWLFGRKLKDGDDNEEGLRQGRAIFFPTWFGARERDVMNPRNRKSRLGSFPISVDRVPAGEKGQFAVFYHPYDLFGVSAEEKRSEAWADLTLLGKAIEATLLVSGFGAKKTVANNGRAVQELDGVVVADESGPLRHTICEAGQLAQLAELYRVAR